MNREIKFRAWNKILQRMETWEELLKQEASGDEMMVWLFQGEDLISLQFTGLLDKNGKEIYESDLLKYPNGDVVVVIFHKGTFCYKMSEHNYHIFDETQIEIIGNIYENPELLKS